MLQVFVVDDAVLPRRTFPEDDMNPRQRAEHHKPKRVADQDFIPPKGPRRGILGCVRVRRLFFTCE